MTNKTYDQLMKENEALKDQIKALITDNVYGIYTRQGLENFVWNEVKDNSTYLIFCDLDHMHDANTLYGYEGVNNRIKESISNVRSSDIVSTGRFFSGDEIIWIVNSGDPYKMAERLQNSFIDNGLSATFGISKIDNNKSFVENATIASDKVQTAKENNLRGTIN